MKASHTLRFRSVMEIKGVNPYVLVSARRVAQIRKDWRKPLPVRVRINGQPESPWHINMMPVGGADPAQAVAPADGRRVGPLGIGAGLGYS